MLIDPGALGPDAWFTTGVVVVALALLVTERIPPLWVLGAAVALLLVSGVITPATAVAGFGNRAVLTVAALLLVTGGLRHTGAIRWVGAWVLGRPRGLFPAQARLVGIAAGMSSVVNNTPIVAMLTSAVENWCRRAKIPPSKLLLPLSYATILGGMCTLIGTSTNLVVAGLARSHPELPPLDLLTPAWVGVPVAISGLLYLVTLGRWLLPARAGAIEQATDTREYVIEMQVDAGGAMEGVTIAQAGLRRLRNLFLAEIERAGAIIPAPAPDTALRSGDRLMFVGLPSGLGELRTMKGLSYARTPLFAVDPGSGRHFVEVVLSRFAPVIGRSVRDAQFRDRYGAVVLAINRHGRQLRQKLGEVVLQSGDTLLLETTPGFPRQHDQSHDFVMLNRVDDGNGTDPRRAFTALAFVVIMIAANLLFGADVLISALAAIAGMLVTGCLPARSLWRALDLPLIATIAFAFAIGQALNDTGVAAAMARLLLAAADASPWHALIAVYVATVVFTELVTNSAAAVLMFPVGLATAAQLGVHPMPFVMTVMFAASASFITPIGYQTNLMVYGPGGYRFLDYVRVGTPLAIIVGAVVTFLVPQVWPF